MIENMEPLHFRTGETIFTDGDDAGSVYLIDKGKVEISKVSQGKKVILATMGWNELFGEMALIDHSARSATAIATEDTWVYMLNKESFEEQIDALHPFMRAIFRSLVKTAKNMTEGQL